MRLMNKEEFKAEEKPVLREPGQKPTVYIVIIAILLLALIGGAAAAWWMWPKGAPATQTAEKPAGTTTETCGCVNNTAPEGFTFYENTVLGFKFAYPSDWGSVTVATTAVGGTGNYIMGNFSANANVSFGGNATDFIVPGRGGTPTDNPGFIKAGGKFYSPEIWKYTDFVTTEDRDDLHIITETTKEVPTCGATGIITQYPHTEFFGYAYDLARVNLKPTNQYFGLNFVVKNPDAAARTQLENLVKTFEQL